MTPEQRGIRSSRRTDGWYRPQHAILVSSVYVLAVSIAPAHRYASATDRDVVVPQPQPVHENHHRPSSSYSLFMHHAAGAVVLVIGMLIVADRMTAHRYRWTRFAQAAAWIGVSAYSFLSELIPKAGLWAR